MRLPECGRSAKLPSRRCRWVGFSGSWDRAFDESDLVTLLTDRKWQRLETLCLSEPVEFSRRDFPRLPTRFALSCSMDTDGNALGGRHGGRGEVGHLQSNRRLPGEGLDSDSLSMDMRQLEMAGCRINKRRPNLPSKAEKLKDGETFGQSLSACL
jgi:hypothetical protein